MKRTQLFIGALLLATFAIPFLSARSFRLDEIPNGGQLSCGTCHVSAAGGGARTAFGETINNNFLSAPGGAGHVVWNAQLAALDSDGDGFTNGEELQDPNGTWSSGQAAPGDPSLVTDPGDPNSKPDPTSVDEVYGPATAFTLNNNYPNPFNPSTKISFTLRDGADINLAIYDVTGSLIKTIAQGYHTSGEFQYSWNGTNNHNASVNSGIYFYRLSSAHYTETKSMVLTK